MTKFLSTVLLGSAFLLPLTSHSTFAMGRKHAPIPDPAPTYSPHPISPSTVKPLDGATSCASSNPSHLCIGVKIVSYVQNGVAVLDRDQAISLINRVSQVWNQCNIGFQLESYDAVDPAPLHLDYDMNWYNDGDKVRSTFKDDSRFLMIAAGKLTGRSNTTGATWDAGTGYGFFGSLIDGAYAQKELTVAHEFGHYQGLYHVKGDTNLLYPYAEPDNNHLTAQQCTTARNSDYHYWQNMLR
jgi:hypothetical protein